MGGCARATRMIGALYSAVGEGLIRPIPNSSEGTPVCVGPDRSRVESIRAGRNGDGRRIASINGPLSPI